MPGLSEVESWRRLKIFPTRLFNFLRINHIQPPSFDRVETRSQILLANSSFPCEDSNANADAAGSPPSTTTLFSIADTEPPSSFGIRPSWLIAIMHSICSARNAAASASLHNGLDPRTSASIVRLLCLPCLARCLTLSFKCGLLRHFRFGTVGRRAL